MSSFAKATFDVANYLACRGTYPPKLYEIITAFHALNGGRFDKALDLGCGPGFMALNLAPHFKSVKAIDPAKKMVAIGLQPEDPSLARIDYQVGSAERLDLVGIGSGEDGVDLVVAGQAAHWFDYPKVWKELTRAVRPGGTVAFVGYAEALFPHHPTLTPLITHHSASPEALGPYWPQPGRSIVEGLLDRTPFPSKPTWRSANDVDLSTMTGLNTSSPPLPDVINEPALNTAEELEGWDTDLAVRLKSDQLGGGIPLTDPRWMMTKTYTLETLEGYFRTWSSLAEYHEKHPDDKALRRKAGNGEGGGDIVDRLMDQIKVGLEKDDKVDGEQEGEVIVGWPLVLMMIKKKGV